MITTNFFGKNCHIERDLNDKTNLQQFLNNNSPICFVNQVHSNNVVSITNQQQILTHQVSSLPKADAMVSNQPNITLAIVTADCIPLLFFDTKKQIIGATHAGFRGAKSGIVENTVIAMQQLGAKNITACLGPCIRQQSYQVSNDFYIDFLQENSQNEQFFVADPNNQHKFLFDLPLYIKHKLKKIAITDIIDNHIDTYSNPELYHSYRRATHLAVSDYGRNISAISLC